MKNKAIVSERGTITIPEAIRKISHIQPGDIVEFQPEKDCIILKHLIVRNADEEKFLTDNEWNAFDKLVQQQLKKGHYTRYTELDKAKMHTRNLLKK
mgnify:CR=1 FL=1